MLTEPLPHAIGRTRDAFGRTEPHPDAPKLRDPAAPKDKPRAVRLGLPQSTRAAVERGARTAHLTMFEPRWTVGDRVTLTRRWHETTGPHGRKEHTQDHPLAVDITHVLSMPVGDLSGPLVLPLGFRTITDFARDHLDVDEHMHALALQARLKRDRRPCWLTRWTVIIPHDTRLLAAAPGSGSPEGYTGSSSQQGAGSQAPPAPAPGSEMVCRFRPEDAGEAVPEDYQRYLADRARPASERAREEQRARAATRRAVAKAKKVPALRESTRRARIERAKRGEGE